MNFSKLVPKVQPKVLYLTLLTLLIFLLGLIGFVRQTKSFNEAEKCYGNICTKLTNNLPAGASRLEENTLVSLNFLIYDTRNLTALNPCASGNKIYHILRQYQGGSSYYYHSKAEGADFNQDFNSGKTGQQNKFEAIFFCDTSPISGTATNVVEMRLNNLRPRGQVYDVTTFSMTTATPLPKPSIVFNPLPQQGYYATGTRVTITGQNFPGNTGQQYVVVNGAPIPANYHPFLYPFRTEANQVENWKLDGSTNTIQVVIKDSAGNDLALENSNLSFKIGQPSTPSPTTNTTTPGATPGSPATSANCTGPNPDPTRCLYNPLPEDELTAMFLLIVKGFLMIVGIWAVMFIIVGGFRMVMAAGNEEQYIAAKKTITWAILGVIVAAMSFSLVAIVQNLLQAEPKPLPFKQVQNKFADITKHRI